MAVYHIECIGLYGYHKADTGNGIQMTVEQYFKWYFFLLSYYTILTEKWMICFNKTVVRGGGGKKNKAPPHSLGDWFF